MENIWICVYRDTIEEHDEDDNLAEVLVTNDFFEQYFKECLANDWKSVDEFLDEYTADSTEDFYSYAMEHNAVIEVRPLYWEDIKENLLNGYYV